MGRGRPPISPDVRAYRQALKGNPHQHWLPPVPFIMPPVEAIALAERAEQSPPWWPLAWLLDGHILHRKEHPDQDPRRVTAGRNAGRVTPTLNALRQRRWRARQRAKQGA
jgi:hypothetical protein